MDGCSGKAEATGPGSWIIPSICTTRCRKPSQVTLCCRLRSAPAEGFLRGSRRSEKGAALEAGTPFCLSLALRSGSH